MARTSGFTQEIADTICERLSAGVSLRTVCKAEDMPDASTVFRWMRQFPDFLAQYERAKEESSDALIEEILDISDDGSNDWMANNDQNNPGFKLNGEHIQRSRLRVDTRKWIASKMKPKKYGDKLHTELTGKDGGPVVTRHLDDADLARRVAVILDRGADKG